MPPSFLSSTPGDEVDVISNGAPSVDAIMRRVDELLGMNSEQYEIRSVIRAIMNGGPEAVQILVGDADGSQFVPAANMMLSAMERHAARIGVMPTTKVDTPVGKDTPSARRRAERKEQAVESYDHWSKLKLGLPQLARWILGYGFAPVILSNARTPGGDPYPGMSIRDPYGCAPGAWGVEQQPYDMVFVRTVPLEHLRRAYPDAAALLSRKRHLRVGGGAVILDNTSAGIGSPAMTNPWFSSNDSWENQTNEGYTVYEYVNPLGRFLVLPDAKLIVDFIPTPQGVERPFHVFKKFSFDRLTGQYDHVVGLMAMLAQQNILNHIQMIDGTFAEVNIFGDIMSGDYATGRFARNYFTQGTRVEKMSTNFIQQQFQNIGLLAEQIRTTANYPRTDDGQSPNSFVTGQGLRELTSGSEAMTQEYQLVIEDGLEELDRLRLRWDDAVWPDYKRSTIVGSDYTPSKDFRDGYRTRRIYGVMAGLDASAKLVGLQNLVTVGLLDPITAMENLDGIDDVQRTLDRLQIDKVQRLLMEQVLPAMLQGQQVDLRVLQVLVAQLPQGQERDLLESVFFPEEPAPLEAGPAQAAAPQGAPLGAGADSVQTILSRLNAGGSVDAGVQTVATT